MKREREERKDTEREREKRDTSDFAIPGKHSFHGNCVSANEIYLHDEIIRVYVHCLGFEAALCT